MKSKPINSFIKNNWIVAASLTLFAIRVFPLIRFPSLWAEDANVFYGPLVHRIQHPPDLFFSVYAGQHWVFLHVISRVIYGVFSGNLRLLPLASTLVSILLAILAASAWLKAKLLILKKRNRGIVFCSYPGVTSRMLGSIQICKKWVVWSLA